MYIDENKIKGQNLDVSKFYNSVIPNNVSIDKKKVTFEEPKTYHLDLENNLCKDVVRCDTPNKGVKSGVYEISSCYNNVFQCNNKIIENENNFRSQLMKALLWKQADRYRGVTEPKFIF